ILRPHVQEIRRRHRRKLARTAHLVEDADELFRVIVWERLEDDRVHHREDSGVCADAERQRQQGDDSEPRRTGQTAEPVADVLAKGVQQRPSPATTVPDPTTPGCSKTPEIRPERARRWGPPRPECPRLGLAVPAPNNSQKAGAWTAARQSRRSSGGEDTRFLIAQHTAIGTIAEERGALRWTIEWTAPEVATTSVRQSRRQS